MTTYKEAERKIYKALEESDIYVDGLLSPKEHEAVQSVQFILSQVSKSPEKELTERERQILAEFGAALEKPQSGLEAIFE